MTARENEMLLQWIPAMIQTGEDILTKRYTKVWTCPAVALFLCSR
jgi:hypothetical protein